MWRRSWWLLLVPALALVARGQDNLANRYGFPVNLNFYPQKTPQEALKALVKAIDNKRIDYLLAHLADPAFVDEAITDYKVSITKGDDKAKLILAFDRLVSETTQYFLDDPTLLKDLRQFGKEGEWEVNDAQAKGALKSVPGRTVHLRKVGERWFLENKQQ